MERQGPDAGARMSESSDKKEEGGGGGSGGRGSDQAADSAVT
jgi:hypothetical protein